MKIITMSPAAGAHVAFVRFSLEIRGFQKNGLSTVSQREARVRMGAAWGLMRVDNGMAP
jgi:hypothetical protein